ncbi:MAG TPA: hypothetical protein VK775_01575 [Chthoniobacterales bacterium]|nr:hypothetical protein [Chthoniobacterales bacterium]
MKSSNGFAAAKADHEVKTDEETAVIAKELIVKNETMATKVVMRYKLMIKSVLKRTTRSTSCESSHLSNARIQVWSRGVFCNALFNPASVAFDLTNLTAGETANMDSFTQVRPVAKPFSK